MFTGEKGNFLKRLENLTPFTFLLGALTLLNIFEEESISCPSS